jgi:hypothetical protein
MRMGQAAFSAGLEVDGGADAARAELRPRSVVRVSDGFRSSAVCYLGYFGISNG